MIDKSYLCTPSFHRWGNVYNQVCAAIEHVQITCNDYHVHIVSISYKCLAGKDPSLSLL